jgi:hypothetical protein
MQIDYSGFRNDVTAISHWWSRRQSLTDGSLVARWRETIFITAIISVA